MIRHGRLPQRGLLSEPGRAIIPLRSLVPACGALGRIRRDTNRVALSLPTISIVTPSFNQAPYLGDAMRSVLAQEYASLQYLVLDGGSTDGSAELIAEVASRLSFSRSGPDEGQAAAIKEGFERSDGEILGWVNSDDALLPGALAAVGEYFSRHPDVDVLSGGARAIDAAGALAPLWRRSAYTLGLPATYDYLRYYGQHFVWQPATFFRRDAYDAVGGVDTGLHYAMDLDLLLRLAKRKSFGRTARILALFRRHAGAKTSVLTPEHQAERSALFDQHCSGGLTGWQRGAAWWRFRCGAVLRGARLQGQGMLLHLSGTSGIATHADPGDGAGAA